MKLAALLPLLIAPVAIAGPPNILLIYADDLGWKDTGYNGSDFYETPNIDRFANEGMVFSNAYAAAANCAPSRACLHSGNYTPRHGVYSVDSTDRGPKQFQKLIPIPNKSGLARSVITLAEALQGAGYRTGIFGKWHLEGKDGAPPGDQGFEVVFDPGANTHHTPEDPKGIFSITREAERFIQAPDPKPFFAFVAHHAIHTEWEARPESLRRFKAKRPGSQHTNATYAAMTYDLDQGVGQLLATLKKRGLDENTLVVFSSDNGGIQQSSQEPLRGNKGSYYEGGIRIPFIARWPGVIRAATSSAVPISQIDLYPTFLAAAGAPVPAGKTLDGENLLPIFKQTGQPARQSLFWHFPGYLGVPVLRGRAEDIRLGFRSRPVSVIRKGDWKLHLFHEEWVDGKGNDALELYNLANDPGEHTDLAPTETAKRDELLKELLKWIKRVGAPIPSETNPHYKEIR